MFTITGSGKEEKKEEEEGRNQLIKALNSQRLPKLSFGMWLYGGEQAKFRQMLEVSENSARGRMGAEAKEKEGGRAKKTR